MTNLEAVAGFAAAASVLAMTPGLDTVLVLSAAARDRCSGWRAAAGIACGCLCWGTLASLGLAALMAASHLGFAILKWMGAAYLFWLGLHHLFRDPSPVTDSQPQPRNADHPFRRGLFTNLLNPKVGIFYLTFVPQFIPTPSGPAAFSFLLASIHIVVSLVWFAILISGTGRLAGSYRAERLAKPMIRLVGILFIALATKTALLRHPG